MIRSKWINWDNYSEFEHKKYIQKRIEKINSLDMFKSKDNVIMNENYYYTFENLRLKRNNKNKELFKIVNYVFYTDARFHYLIDYKEFNKFYSACKKVQNIILKENKLQENKKRKEKVMNLFK